MPSAHAQPVKLAPWSHLLHPFHLTCLTWRAVAGSQARIEECDRRGSGNAALAPDEDPSVFPDILAGASTAEEVAECVDLLLMT